MHRALRLRPESVRTVLRVSQSAKRIKTGIHTIPIGRSGQAGAHLFAVVVRPRQEADGRFVAVAPVGDDGEQVSDAHDAIADARVHVSGATSRASPLRDDGEQILDVDRTVPSDVGSALLGFMRALVSVGLNHTILADDRWSQLSGSDGVIINIVRIDWEVDVPTLIEGDEQLSRKSSSRVPAVVSPPFSDRNNGSELSVEESPSMFEVSLDVDTVDTFVAI